MNYDEHADTTLSDNNQKRYGNSHIGRQLAQKRLSHSKATVIAYLRVSSVNQIHGDGFTRQAQAVAAWAAANRVAVSDTIMEEGVSGTKDIIARPGLSRLFEQLSLLTDQDQKPVVVVEKADRLARDLIVSELILRQFKELGVTVIEAEGGTDMTASSDNPTSTLIRQILAAVAEFEKSGLVLKMRAARQRMRTTHGRCEGQKPFGHTQDERKTLDRMIELYVSGLPTRCIASCLNAEGHSSRSSKPWTHGSVAKILKANKDQATIFIY